MDSDSNNAQRPSMNFASEALIRMAVIDTVGGDAYGWMFADADEDHVNESLMRFADAVQIRIRQLQSPPHSGVKLENFCDRHKRSLLPEPTKSTCALCNKEQL